VITVDKPVHDFGEHWASPKMEHTFLIRNTGNAPLKITQVRPGCGCTVAGNYPREIAPGGTGEFPFTLNVSRYQGPYHKPIYISSNDPVHPRIKLELKGVCKQRIETRPMGAFFGVLLGDQPITRLIRIHNNTDTPLKLAIKPPSNPGPFTFELSETDPGKDFALKVTARPPWGPVGMKRVNVTLTTNLKEEPEKTIYVTGHVQPRLVVRPSTIRILPPPTTRPGQPARPMPPQVRVRGLTLINYGSEPVQITSATVDDPALKVTYQKLGTTNNYSIRITWPEGYTVPKEGRTLTIKTDDTEFPEFKIPILGAYQRPKPRESTQRRVRPAELLVGKPAPAFKLTSVDGKEVSKQVLAGKVSVLNFFSPRCPFCRKQLPRVDKMRSQYEAKGVRFINVSQTMRQPPYTQEQVVEAVKQMGVSGGELVIDKGNKVGRLFKAVSYPTMIVVGKNGMIEAVNIGNLKDLEKRVAAQLDALLAGKAIPAQYLPSKKQGTQAQSGGTGLPRS